MEDRLIFLIGAPRSGTTLLARMLSTHSAIHGRAEPHLLVPLAHLGYYNRVDKAPYDPFIVQQAAEEYVRDLPRGEADYLDALRAYTNTMYERMLAPTGKRFFLDKTPANALALPFLTKLYPKARYVVITRHPVAVFASYAESFFDDDYDVAQQHNPILGRYVPAISKFLRDRPVSLVHVQYEQLVADPEARMNRIFEFLDLSFEPGTIDYGGQPQGGKGLGDPINVARHTRPVTGSVEKWAEVLARDAGKLEKVRRLTDRLDPADLAAWGYPAETLYDAIARVRGAPVPPRRARLTRYRLERKLLVALRRNVQHNALGRLLRKLRLALDVILRE
ncbi:MAG: sulfotransferase [Myxococcota bacterium]